MGYVTWFHELFGTFIAFKTVSKVVMIMTKCKKYDFFDIINWLTFDLNILIIAGI